MSSFFIVCDWVTDQHRESDNRTLARAKDASHLFHGAFVLVSSIWLQFIWLAVGSTVKTRDLIKLNNNSIPIARSIMPVDAVGLTDFHPRI